MLKPGKISEAMVLCAGLGTRMRPLTDNIPKPLIKVLGKSILDYIVESLVDYSITKIVINTHYLYKQLEERVEKYRSIYHDVQFITTYEPEILDSAGGVKNAAKYFTTESIFVINGDVIFLNNKVNTLEYLDSHYENEDCLMAGVTMDNAVGYDGKGDFVFIDEGRIVRYKEGETTEKPYIFPGIQILKLSVLDKINKAIFSLREIYYSSDLDVKAIELPNMWLHIGTPENLKNAENFLKKA